MIFELNKKLEQDTIYVKDEKLCTIRLMNNADFPWLILIPRLPNIIEITDLSLEDYHQLNIEILSVAKIMQQAFSPDKLNIATIGNVVSQMHVHVVARFKNDKLFPSPVWGYSATPYSSEGIDDILRRLY